LLDGNTAGAQNYFVKPGRGIAQDYFAAREARHYGGRAALGQMPERPGPVRRLMLDRAIQPLPVQRRWLPKPLLTADMRWCQLWRLL
jgi:hypothetical protein